MSKLFIFLIKKYQILSRIFISDGSIPAIIPSACRFYPSCSEYSIMAFEKYGFWEGFIKSAWRITKCNPLSKPGPDLP